MRIDVITLLARHQVNDFDTWMSLYQSQRSELAALGVTREAALRATADGNDVIVVHEFETLETAEAFIAMANQPDMQEMLKASGVVGPVTLELFTNL